MIDVKKKSSCSGCHACYSICPKKCITMVKDKDGFKYPLIDQKKCIECNLCQKVCHYYNTKEVNNSPKTYACINKNDEIRMKSSSGGIFTLLAEKIIDMNGAVFGAAFIDSYSVHHICVEDKSQLGLLRGSKYLQSVVGDTYIKAKQYLENGRYVLFTGTPCQIDGLLDYLNKDYDKLYTQDLICHGAPSPKVWSDYLNYMCAENNDMLHKSSLPNFRLKNGSWRKYSVCINFEEKAYISTLDKDMYMAAFLKNLCLRPSCYDCHSKSIHRSSDITLADFWSIENVLPEMFDDKGTSLVMVNSKKGKDLFEKITSDIRYAETDINDSLKANPSAFLSVKKPKKYNKFMRLVGNENFKSLVQECTKDNIYKKIKIKLRNMLKNGV